VQNAVLVLVVWQQNMYSAVHGIQGLVEIADTHRPIALGQAFSEEHRTTLGVICFLDFE
jgi:hypothetical protein